ncbi:ArsC family reductase [Sphingomonas yunnanensis]|uniref:ArsC family reductase n=1 Tax=Sphingomonas yunnanensis TaxID=310400 RepID=UPI001CA6EABE|nr:ArsC family reductase [Sphingomonas yunnanensis]MBY9061663.1 ArsC family reductase [Sphingomonas yunnanensis]
MITLHGIPHCDTVKRARLWLADHNVAHRFHDFRRDGLDPALLDAWIDRLGWEPLLNRAGTTFRKLPEPERAGLDRVRATALMLAQPAMIKRPVLVHDGGVEVGFKPEFYNALFG